jgi:hypothetical protein
MSSNLHLLFCIGVLTPQPQLQHADDVILRELRPIQSARSGLLFMLFVIRLVLTAGLHAGAGQV